MSNEPIENKTEVVIDVPERGTIEITVHKEGVEVTRRRLPYQGNVDNALLTTIDNLFRENILDKFVSINVVPGQGIDKSSLLYRIVISLGAALQRTRSEDD